MAFATLLSMLIGELVPKNMAIALSFQVDAALLTQPQLIFTAIFRPAIVVLNGFSNKVLNIFGLEAKEEISGLGLRRSSPPSSAARRRWEPSTPAQPTSSPGRSSSRAGQQRTL